MFANLLKALHELPELLSKPEVWTGSVFDQNWIRLHSEISNGMTVCLNRYGAGLGEFVMHPVSGELIILHGSFKIQVGCSMNHENNKPMTFIIREGSQYSIIDSLAYHSVCPLETTFTVFVTGDEYEEHHHQKPMLEDDLEEELNIFDILVTSHNQKMFSRAFGNKIPGLNK